MAKEIDLYSNPYGAIKIYEPAMKDENDQYVYALEQIQQLGQGPVINMQQAPTTSDAVSLFTGLAGVTDTGSASVFNSTGPQRINEGPSQSALLLMGMGIFVIVYNFLGGKK